MYIYTYQQKLQAVISSNSTLQELYSDNVQLGREETFASQSAQVLKANISVELQSQNTITIVHINNVQSDVNVKMSVGHHLVTNVIGTLSATRGVWVAELC